MARQFQAYSPTVDATPMDSATTPWPYGPLQTVVYDQKILVRTLNITRDNTNTDFSSIQVECYNATTNQLVATREFDASDFMDDTAVFVDVIFEGLANGQTYHFKARRFREVP